MTRVISSEELDMFCAPMIARGTDPYVAGLAALLAKRRGAQDGKVIAAAESPVEELFLISCLISGWVDGEEMLNWATAAAWDLHMVRDPARVPHGFKRCLIHTNIGASMFVQAKLRVGGRHIRRTDALIVAHQSFLVVELDGHDFHERTKEQARRDKSRDRELQMLGCDVFRFTGSEVWKEPVRPIQEIYQWMRSKEPTDDMPPGATR